LLNRQTANLY